MMPQHPLHERPAVHADPRQLPHERRPADDPGEQAGHLEVLAVLGLRAAWGSPQGQRVAVDERLVDRVGGHVRGLVGVVDALAVERVDRAGGVADHQVGRALLGPDRAAHGDAAADRARRGVGGVDLPAVGDHVRVAVEQVGGVDALEVAERGQQPDADVDRAVAHREDPAVAGQRVAVAVLHVERRLDPRLVVAGRLPVGADGRAVGPLLRPERPEGPTEAAVGAVGHDDVAGAELDAATAASSGLDDRAARRTRGRSPAPSASVPWSRVAPATSAFWRHHPVELASAHDVAVAAGTPGARATAAPASGPVRCSAGRRTGGTWPAPRRGPCPGAASRPVGSGRRRRSSRAGRSCARRRRRRARGGPASRPPTRRRARRR